MIEFPATYYDGRTARGVRVLLCVDEQAAMLAVHGLPDTRVSGAGLDGAEPRGAGLGGAESNGAELTAPLLFALGEVHIAPRVANTVRSVYFPQGGQCETSNNTALELMLRWGARGRRSGFVHAWQSQPRSVLAACAALVFTLFSLVVWIVPALVNVAADAMPGAAGHALGRGALKLMDRAVLKPSRLDAEDRARLEQGFAEMAKGYPDLPLELAFRSGIGPNAFALPDGTVVVSDWLVLAAHRDQEIWGVLAHEIGHVHHRHGLRALLRSTSMALLAGAYLGDVTQVTTLAPELPTALLEARYSRDQERDADAFALAQLERTGIEPYHLADMLRTLQRLTEERAGEAGSQPERGAGFDYLRSHPPTTERIALLEQSLHQEPLVRLAASKIRNVDPTALLLESSLLELLEANKAAWHAHFEAGADGRSVVLLPDEATLRLAQQAQREIGPIVAEWERHYHAETLPGLLGLQPLDAIRSINDIPVHDAASLEHALGIVRSTSALSVELERYGKPVELTYALRGRLERDSKLQNLIDALP